MGAIISDGSISAFLREDEICAVIGGILKHGPICGAKMLRDTSIDPHSGRGYLVYQSPFKEAVAEYEAAHPHR